MQEPACPFDGFWFFSHLSDEIIRAGINLWRWRTGKWKGMGIVQPAARSDHRTQTILQEGAEEAEGFQRK